MSLAAPMMSGADMKLYAKADLVVDGFGCVKTSLIKEDGFKSRFNTFTSGNIKYMHDLPEGTKVRVTVEVVEDGDCSQ